MRYWKNILLITAVLVLLGTLTGFPAAFGEETLRVYANRFDPAEHPDRDRLFVTPPDWQTFDGKTQFITLRGFPAKDGVGQYEETIDQFQNENLGRILWPHSGTIFHKNLDELAEIVQKRDLYLFDFWGYVPGSGPHGSGDWAQFRADPAQFRLLEEKLGPRWLGMDNGEQDGRYIGGYAYQNHPVSEDRFQQYLRFQRHFERLGDDLGNRLATLVSLNFGHYFLKEGIYTLIGAETAQGLPNSQVYYSWIRGAGKEYGVLWFGNASVWNRWGWKDYNGKPTDQSGPTKGTSLNLLKRLIYSHIFYNSAAVGYENGWFVGTELGAIGTIQKSAAEWLDKNGDPGTMVTPVALLNDFGSGWSFPRHLYSDKTYKVWGIIPYDAGDYLTDNLFGLLYPGYQDSSYFHNETGFMTATPFGDSADTLLTDTPLWLLDRYALVIAANRLTVTEELRDKLTAYVENGGRLVMTAGNLAQFGSFCGVSVSGPAKHFDAQTVVTFSDQTEITEDYPFDLYPLDLPNGANVLSQCNGQTAVAAVSAGKGSLVILASDFGIPAERTIEGRISSSVDQYLQTPYPLLSHVKKTMEAELSRTVLFHAGDDLGLIVCRKGEKCYTVAVFNSNLSPRPLKITSHIGEIKSIRELPVNQAERNEIGFLPEGSESADLGTDSDEVIAGASVRIFEVILANETISAAEPDPMPKRPRNRTLTLSGQTPVKEAVLARPTFFQHYDGVMVDWTYFAARSMEQVQAEAGWIQRQKLTVTVDFSSGLNLFPDLRLLRNDPEEFERSRSEMESVIEKAAVWGADTILLSSHRFPENNYSHEQSSQDLIESLRHLCLFAGERGMTVLVRCQDRFSERTPETALALANAVDKPNFRLALSPSFLEDALSSESFESVQMKTGSILAAGSAADENNGVVWSETIPLSQAEQAVQERTLGTIRRFTEKAGNRNDVRIIFDAVYSNGDEEYRDVRLLEDFLSR